TRSRRSAASIRLWTPATYADKCHHCDTGLHVTLWAHGGRTPMRTTARSDVLRARAIAGTYVVVLAWDFQPGQEDKHKGLMGFAIERRELKNGQEVERYWMRSIKRFREKDRGLPPGTPVSTAAHPIQSFQWADYTALANHTYRYRIVPTYGPSKNL